MQILVKGFASGYEIEHLARVFYPLAAVRGERATKGCLVYARAGRFRLVAALRLESGRLYLRGEKRPTGSQGLRADKQALSRLVYGLLREATGIHPPWGMLTGVRPVRLYRNAAALGEAHARERLLAQYHVSPEKLALVQGIHDLQAPLLGVSRPESYSLYVSIPFCPTRCNYCSFVSQTIGRQQSFAAPYLDKLVEELRFTARLAEETGLRLETVYIGGGTPTALDAGALERLLQAVTGYFPVNEAREFTVEAGRPDCTGRQKLALLKQYGVSRISINPQTLNDEVLAGIGRRHTAADVLRCFEEARAEGHRNINMDLIAGLPGDGAAGFEASLEGLLALCPENITVHTLTLKRASNYVIEAQSTEGYRNAPAEAMLERAYPALSEAGYRPYYLYRQKNTVGNLENSGWCLRGKEGLYNVYIMEETHTILACGANASSKFVRGNTIKRSFNHKFPADYIEHFDQVLERKKGVFSLYAGHLDTETTG